MVVGYCSMLLGCCSMMVGYCSMSPLAIQYQTTLACACLQRAASSCGLAMAFVDGSLNLCAALYQTQRKLGSTWLVGGEPQSAVALVARPLRAAAAAAAAVVAVVAAHEQLHDMVPDCAVRISCTCIALIKSSL